MKAMRIAIFHQVDNYDLWEEMAQWYQDMGTDDMVAMIRNRYPELITSEDDPCLKYYEEEIEGEIQDETAEHILTWEDGMGECMRIYKKTA